MSSLALMDVQRSLYDKLKADSALMNMVEGVYDAVPQRSSFPYIVLGDGSARMVTAEGANVTECSMEVNVWTSANGRKTALLILERLNALLHLNTLSLDNHQQLTLRVQQASTALDDPGAYVRGKLGVLVTVVETV